MFGQVAKNGTSGRRSRTGRLAGRWSRTSELGMGALAGRWEWEFWIRHGRAGGSGWVFGQAVKDGTFELDMGALARMGVGALAGMGVGVLDSTWRPEQVAGGQGAEGLSGRESSYSGRAASVPSKDL